MNDTDAAAQQIGRQVHEARKSAKLSQAGLVEAIRAAGIEGWHQTTLSRVEAGKRPVSIDEAIVIANILGTDLGVFDATEQSSKTLTPAKWGSLMSTVDQIQREIDDLRGELEELRPSSQQKAPEGGRNYQAALRMVRESGMTPEVQAEFIANAAASLGDGDDG